MEKILISLALTVFLGPGAGHFYLRLFKQGFLLLGLTLLSAVLLAFSIARSLSATALQTGVTTDILRQFYAENPRTILYFDLVFAAIWAFALVDAYQKARALMPPPDQEPQEEE